MKKVLFLFSLLLIAAISFAQTTATVQINSIETQKIGKYWYDAVTFTIDATHSEIYGVSISVDMDGERSGGGGLDNPRAASHREGTYTVLVGVYAKNVNKDRTYTVNVWADSEWIHSEPVTVTGK